MAINKKHRWILAAWVAYVVLVHSIDCLATQGVTLGIDWSVFLWRSASGFDAYKALAWLGLPLVLSLWRFDAAYFSLKRCKRADGFLLLALFGAGALAVGAILFVPSLRRMYPSLDRLPPGAKLDWMRMNLLFLSSWLVGWEFLHRYVLVKAIREAFPQRALVVSVALIPAIEALYHVGQRKPPLENLAMFFYGAVLCAWATQRGNTLLPFLAHLFIELALLAFVLLV